MEKNRKEDEGRLRNGRKKERKMKEDKGRKKDEKKMKEDRNGERKEGR